MQFKTLSSVFVLISWTIEVKSDIFGINPTPQPKGKDVTQNVFGTSIYKDSLPVAYGDFNADKLTDIVTVSRNRSSLKILLASKDIPYMREGPEWHFNKSHTHAEQEIISVALGDFTGDGLIDLMVTLRSHAIFPNHYIPAACYNATGHNKSSTDKYEYPDVYCIHLNVVEVHFCTGIMNEINCSKILEKLVQEPLALDLNRDMIFDLVGETWKFSLINESAPWNFTYGNGTCQFLQTPTAEKYRSIWLSEYNEPAKRYQPFTTMQNGSKILSLLRMSSISSNAFVDVDGDFVPELVITTENASTKSQIEYFRDIYEVKFQLETIYHPVTFKLKSNSSLDPGRNISVIGQHLFIDLERNGKLVNLVPFCSNKLCSNLNGNGIMVIDGNKTAILSIGSLSYDGLVWGFVPPVDPVDSSKEKKNSTPTVEDFYSSSLTFRAGDYTLDGYPDLIAVLETQAPTGRRSKAVIFENVPCTPTLEKPCIFSRTFNANFKFLDEYENVVSATFFDLHEDGVVDVLVLKRTINSSYELRAFQNTPNFDSYFIKVAVLTARPCPNCTIDHETPYGSLVPGALMVYKMKNQYGEVETAISSQMYRTSHMPMDLPYTIFGIGHSPNFVEHLKFIIGHSKTEIYSHDSEQIIPNSQIVAIPPFPLSSSSSIGWKVRLFLTPSDAVLNTFGVLIGIVVVVAAIAASLEFKERREDRKERMAVAHRFMM